MTATEVLRAMLDERGVEWTEVDKHTLWWGESIHHKASAYSSILFAESERVHLSAMVTPEQAVEATLGRGECRVVRGTAHTNSSCSECGMVMNARDRYCRWCGRKVRA